MKVIHKQFPSSFTDTDLKEHLEKIGKKKVVVTGMYSFVKTTRCRKSHNGTGYMAHVCVSSTTRAGDELGYDMSVVKDGIGDRDVPGASASQLVEVGDSIPESVRSFRGC